MTQWTTPQHSKNEVSRASKVLSQTGHTEEEVNNALKIITNFRSAHAYPLNAVVQTVRNRAHQVDENAVVAQRLKRLPTIRNKLLRYPDMSVSNMQDLGGCRVIFDDVSKVRSLANDLTNLTRAQNRVTRTYNYLTADPADPKSGPKNTGYRGIHLRYTYNATKREFKNLKIELQVRTQLQHAWSTSIETLDLFEMENLKYGRGSADFSRFFVLVSSLMAIAEGTSLAPGAEGSRRDLLHELKELENRYAVTDRLSRYALAAKNKSQIAQGKWLVLELQRKERILTISSHGSQQEAEEQLADLESRGDDNLDVVLVETGKISQLEAAYPNYYADTETFVRFVRSNLETV